MKNKFYGSPISHKKSTIQSRRSITVDNEMSWGDEIKQNNNQFTNSKLNNRSSIKNSDYLVEEQEI